MAAMKTLATFAPKFFDVLNTIVLLPFCLVAQFVILLCLGTGVILANVGSDIVRGCRRMQHGLERFAMQNIR